MHARACVTRIRYAYPLRLSVTPVRYACPLQGLTRAPSTASPERVGRNGVIAAGGECELVLCTPSPTEPETLPCAAAPLSHSSQCMPLARSHALRFPLWSSRRLAHERGQHQSV
jgi:hypothetical protein